MNAKSATYLEWYVVLEIGHCVNAANMTRGLICCDTLSILQFYWERRGRILTRVFLALSRPPLAFALSRVSATAHEFCETTTIHGFAYFVAGYTCLCSTYFHYKHLIYAGLRKIEQNPIPMVDPILTSSIHTTYTALIQCLQCLPAWSTCLLFLLFRFRQLPDRFPGVWPRRPRPRRRLRGFHRRRVP